MAHLPTILVIQTTGLLVTMFICHTYKYKKLITPNFPRKDQEIMPNTLRLVHAIIVNMRR